jgi:hypothetical protein
MRSEIAGFGDLYNPARLRKSSDDETAAMPRLLFVSLRDLPYTQPPTSAVRAGYCKTYC